MTRLVSTAADQSERPSAAEPLPAQVQIFAYRPLLKYLDQRFADTVVLTFTQIEDLLGFALAAEASMQETWWTDGGEPPSVQSAAWTKAQRSAVPNLRARSVAFSRVVVSRTPSRT
ncbi:MAG: hypothetical protein ABI634_14725 [Acidobacteriota bacterium]